MIGAVGNISIFLSSRKFGCPRRSISSGSSLRIFASQGPLQDPCHWTHLSICLFADFLQDPNLRTQGPDCRSTHQCGSLQNPRFRIHIPTSLNFFEIPVKSMSQDFFTDPSQNPNLGTQTSPYVYPLQGPLQDPYFRILLSISGYLRILCKIHIPGSIYPIHVLATTNLDAQGDPDLWIHVSGFLYLRVLCKIHIFGTIFHRPYISQDPLLDPYFRIQISASICIFYAKFISPGPWLRFIYNIYLSGTVVQSNIHISASLYMDPLQNSPLHYTESNPVKDYMNIIKIGTAL